METAIKIGLSELMGFFRVCMLHKQLCKASLFRAFVNQSIYESLVLPYWLFIILALYPVALETLSHLFWNESAKNSGMLWLVKDVMCMQQIEAQI